MSDGRGSAVEPALRHFALTRRVRLRSQPMRYDRIAAAAVRVLLACAAGVAAASAAGAPLAIDISLAPVARRALAGGYGLEEAPTLEAELRGALARAIDGELQDAAAARGLRMRVVIEEVRPTHPTRREVAASPAIDPLRSLSRGGAVVTGTVLDAEGHTLGSVTQRRFAAELAQASAAGDAWADARIAFDQLARALAARLRSAVNRPAA